MDGQPRRYLQSKEALAALRRSEQRYRAMVQAVAQIVWIADAAGEVTEELPSWQDFTGQSFEQVKGRGWMSAIHPEDRAEAVAVLTQAMAEHKSIFHIHRLRRHDGEYRYFHNSAAPVFGEDGKVREWVGACVDITEHKLAEQKLKEEEEKFRSLVEQDMAGIYIVREDGTLGYANPHFARIVGCSQEEMIGLPLLDFVADDQKAKVAESLRSQLVGGELTVQWASAAKDKDGKRIDVLISRRLAQFEGKRALIGLALDITARKKIEDQLEFSNLLMTTAIENSPDGILVVDEHAKIKLFNRHFVEMWRLPQDVVAARADGAVLETATKSVKNPEKFVERVKFLYDHPEFSSHDEIELLDGRLFDRHTASLWSGDQRYLGRIWYFRDITERRNAELRLRKTNRALHVLSAGNMALVRAKTLQELFDAMCRTVVANGHYMMAAIGIAEDNAEKTVRIAANAGDDTGYFETIQIRWDDGPLGQGPMGTAIRTGVAQINNDSINNPMLKPWREQALKLGYASSIALPLKDRRGGVFGVLAIYAADSNAFDAVEVGLLSELAADMSYGITALQTQVAHDIGVERLARSMSATVQALASTAELRDPYTAGHQRRVAKLSASIARSLGLDEEEIKGIEVAATVHDIGKIHIPAEILSKPGRLSKAEFDLLRGHPEAGYEILKGIDFPWPVADVVLQHHERYDGSGYPHGLKGEAIELGARIIAVADTVEAMTAHRPYRPGLGIEKALAEIEDGKGVRYDPAVVNACRDVLRGGAVSLE